MRLGKLRNLITFLEPIETRDADGGISVAWNEIGASWGSVEPLTGREFTAQSGIVAEISHRIYARYFPGVVPKMRIGFGSRSFDIIAAINVKERGAELEILCKEVV